MVDLSFLNLRNVLLWIGGWSLIGFLLMGEDKDLAVLQAHFEQKERISERTLHEVSLMGGFPGIIVGARILHHKTSKTSFWPAVALSILVWVVSLYAVVSGRLTISNTLG